MERKLLSFRTSVIAALAALTLAGCSSLNPDIRAVKDTVIEENHSFFTVGRVIDFYPDCKDTNWDAYKDLRDTAGFTTPAPRSRLMTSERTL